MAERSSNAVILEVVWRSHSMAKSSFCTMVLLGSVPVPKRIVDIYFRQHQEQEGLTWMPQPLSVICKSFRPPSLASTSRDVDPASTAFSTSSLRACTGATMISPAAILLTTSGSNACWGQRGKMVSKKCSLMEPGWQTEMVRRGLSLP
jgi:hypothetical protein